MLKHTLLTLPVLGLLALMAPAQAAAPGMAAAAPGQAKANSSADIVLVQQQHKGNHKSAGGNAKPNVGNFKQSNKVVVRVVPGRTVHRSGGNHRGTRYLWGGLPFYFYDGYYHGDCSWLRRRAKETGSPYWWSRYRQCRSD